MAQPTPLEELYSDSRAKAKKEALAQAVEQQRAAECSFAPDISKSAAAMKDQQALALRSSFVSGDGRELSQRISR